MGALGKSITTESFSGDICTANFAIDDESSPYTVLRHKKLRQGFKKIAHVIFLYDNIFSVLHNLYFSPNSDRVRATYKGDETGGASNAQADKKCVRNCGWKA
jgi:hypothetical protein